MLAANYRRAEGRADRRTLRDSCAGWWIVAGNARHFVSDLTRRHNLVMVVTTTSGQRLFVRPLAATAARALDGTEGAVGPFWSPDSRSIAFFSGGQLRRIPVEGGTPQRICALSGPVFSARVRGGPTNDLDGDCHSGPPPSGGPSTEWRPLEASQSPCCSRASKTVISPGRRFFRTAGISSFTRRPLGQPPKSEWRRLILRKRRG